MYILKTLIWFPKLVRKKIQHWQDKGCKCDIRNERGANRKLCESFHYINKQVVKDLSFLLVLNQVNAGITVQILVDVFDIEGVVHYGIAGSANDSLSIADVVVQTHVAFTNSWKWKVHNSIFFFLRLPFYSL